MEDEKIREFIIPVQWNPVMITVKARTLDEAIDKVETIIRLKIEKNPDSPFPVVNREEARVINEEF